MLFNDVPTFTMLVGLPGSGKSTYAKQWVEKHGGVIHSSDAIREELTGNVNEQKLNSKVFEVLHNRVKEDLRNAKHVVYDATNINSKRRKAFLQQLSNINCVKRACIIASPYEVCLEQNERRDRVVPEEVIEKMYRNFEVPYWHEGWDDIRIFYPYEEYQWCYETPADFIYSTIDFSQDNSHHTLNLGMHCLRCRDYITSIVSKRTSDTPNYEELVAAALIHDCGKPFTKTFVNMKGVESEEAHYYNHEKVGSYNALFYNLNEDIDKLYVSALIQYHMVMHFMTKWKDKTIQRYREMFEFLPDNFWNNLKLLHEADCNAH